MKTPKALSLTRIGLTVLKITAVASMVAPVATVLAQSKTVVVQPSAQAMETQMDLPADFHRFYGQRVNQFRDTERKIAKLDMDGDLNYDGVISNTDPGDQGAFESTPPGLVVGEKELTRLILRVDPYRLDYPGEVVVTLEVSGINRADKSGRFGSMSEELPSVGHIRVWRDAEQTDLILDSAVEGKRVFEWVVDAPGFAANLPYYYPRMVYVEGVKASPQFLGDVRLLVTVSHRRPGETRETFAEYKKKPVKSFRTSFDHMLLTVSKTPQVKEFITNNVEGVWLPAK